MFEEVDDDDEGSDDEAAVEENSRKGIMEKWSEFNRIATVGRFSGCQFLCFFIYLFSLLFLRFTERTNFS